jgi:hypothetical protein
METEAAFLEKELRAFNKILRMRAYGRFWDHLTASGTVNNF